MAFFDSDTFTFILLPILIFIARICDVTIGTMRIISVSRGHKFLAPLLGFFEVLIWIIVIGKIMQNLNNIACYIAYAGGFAAGNFVGILIEEKLAIGMQVVRIITQKDASELIIALGTSGYGATSIAAQGSTGRVDVVYTIINRSNLKDVVEIIKKFNPKAFYSVEDTRFVSEGVFPAKKYIYRDSSLSSWLRMWRKGK